jgi:outer membrane lipoprotein-sorting protein
MRRISIFLFVLFLAVRAFAQTNTMSSAADSDPKAKAILDKLRDKYEGYSSLKLTFDLTLAFAEQPEEVQKGTLLRKGDSYRLDLPQQAVLSDGESLWIILHNNREVQINNVPESPEESIMSPQALFSFYESGDFAYALVNEMADKRGRVLQQIEFKPLDRTSEYSKVRLEIDKNKLQPVRMLAFGKDGSRYILEITGIQPNASIPGDSFSFSESDYPDYYVEDLRY